MAYVEIKDFKNGLDTRRPAIVGEPGSLIKCINAHITRGGDVESAKKFVKDFQLPDGTKGMHSRDNKLYVFGHAAAPTGLPGHIVYQRLEHPTASSTAIKEILYYENFDGLIYAIAEFEDGSVFHYYDGAHVSDWDTQAAAIADDESVAKYLADKVEELDAFTASTNVKDIIITASEPGVAFTIDKAVTGTGTLTITNLQANGAAVAEVRAEASFEVTDGFSEENNVISAIKAGATDLIGASVPYVLNDEGTVLACVNAINALTETHGYLATSAGAVVTIKAPEGEGAAENGTVLTVTAEAFVTVDNVNNFSGGVTAVEPVAQVEKVTVGGTFDVANTYTIELNGTEYTITGLSSGMSRIARTFKTKMHTAARALMVFSALNDPTQVTSGTGIGSILASSQDEGTQRITGMGIYQTYMGIFSRNTIQIWAIDTDPANNRLVQVLQNTGTRSPKAIIGFGNSDLAYLADTGVRSLRARDSSNAAFVDDIGTKIDDDITAFMETLTDKEIAQADTVVDPRDGRLWISLKNRIYVFSYFPGGRISAWSFYEPGFTVDEMAVAKNRIYVRSGNTIYVYGGNSGAEYPADGEMQITVQLPFIDADRLSGGKQLKGVDIITSGEWEINLLVDPRDETLMTDTLRTVGPSTLLMQIPVHANTTHFAPLLRSSKAGRKTLSSVVVHFDDTEPDV